MRQLVVELRGERRGLVRSMVLSLLIVLAVLLPIGGFAPAGPIAPGPESAAAQSYPGWMTPEQAALFTNDWPALVPSYVPEPFASVVPSISIDGSTYRIYWYVGGGTPTFLEVRGYLNGYIPAGSAYDLNVELKVNSSVRGNEAYHDPTPIYDAVYWREGGPSYWANSQGLSTDIVSYANSFTYASAPAPEPTATVPTPATLYSPDSIASGETGTVTASGGGIGGTLTAAGGYFPDTGTASYPGAGDAAVAWVAPDVTVDTTVTFSLLDASGAVLVTTPTLVTAAQAPVTFSLACAPTVGVGEALSVSVTGSGSVMLDSSAGSWPQTSPNNDYDPGTDGATLAFSLGGGGTAMLTWVAPASAQTATIQAYGPSGIVVGSCQVEVVGETPTAAPTAPVATSTTPATRPAGGVATVAPSATVGSDQPGGNPTATAPGTNPGDGTDPGSGPQPTVPGTGSGDGIDSGGGTNATATIRSGDGTDLGGAATVPPGATYPAIPTSAPLPDAPPTSIPPGDGAPTAVGQAPQATVAAEPTQAASTEASTAPPATVAATTAPATLPPATQISVTPTATAIPASVTPAPTSTAPPVPATAAPRPATATATARPPTAVPATARPTDRPRSVPSTATVVPPTATVVSPTATTAPAPMTTTPPTATTLPATPIPTKTPPPDVTEAALAVQPTTSPTPTALPPTATPRPLPATPTATSIPPTATSTAVPPTATSVPPTPTVTTVPPTATIVPPTPTATTVPPTANTAPPAATATRRPPATATATPVRSGQGNRVAGAQPMSPTPTVISTIGPTAPPATPTGSTPGASPTVPPAAESVTQEIGPAGGTVRHPAGAELQVGPGVFDAKMTVSMTQVPDTELPISSDVDLVPSSGYDIEITGADGRQMTTLPTGVVLRLSVPENVRDDAVVYWIDGGQLTQLGVTNQEDAGISAPLAHLSRYVAGVPLDENPELGWLPWAVAIAAAISGLLIVGLLASHSRRQRRRGLRTGRSS